MRQPIGGGSRGTTVAAGVNNEGSAAGFSGAFGEGIANSDLGKASASSGLPFGPRSSRLSVGTPAMAWEFRPRRKNQLRAFFPFLEAQRTGGLFQARQFDKLARLAFGRAERTAAAKVQETVQGLTVTSFESGS